MKIVLFLMNKKGLRSLEAVYDKYGSNIISAVVCSRDVNVKDDYYEDIFEYCKCNNIRFYDRKNFNDYRADYYIAIGWRWIINSAENVIVLHDSLLPKYRGFSPLVNALINGEEEIGVTAIYANEEFDKGDIIYQKSIKVQYPIKIAEAIDKIIEIYQDILIYIIDRLLKDELTAYPQIEEEATYSIWRDEEDYHINWSDSAEKIVRFINAVGFPYQGAYSYVDGNKVFILSADIYDDIKMELRHIGKTIFLEDGKPIVVAKRGLVKINSMVDAYGNSLLPLKKYRVRFK